MAVNESVAQTAEVTPQGERRATVVLEDVHVTYRVLATGKRAQNEGRRLLRRAPAGRRTRDVHAVSGVSFTAYEGEAIGVVGHNGSGKSTLLRVVAGLTAPTRGAVFADGEPTLLGVNAALINDLSGERNVILGGLALGLTPQQIRDKYDEIVDFAGIGDFISLPMRTYSSGMGQRLKFAIAAATEHRVLLVDEALAVGDESFQRRSEGRIKELRAAAGTVFLVSHAMRSILDTCERTLWIDHGKLKIDGPTEEVVKAYQDSVR